jgi:hypothetical protein
MSDEAVLLSCLLSVAVYSAWKLTIVVRRVEDVEHRLRHLNPIGEDERFECEMEAEALSEGDPVPRALIRRRIWKTKTKTKTPLP